MSGDSLQQVTYTMSQHKVNPLLCALDTSDASPTEEEYRNHVYYMLVVRGLRRPSLLTEGMLCSPINQKGKM